MIVAVTVECSPFSAVLSFHTKGTLICGRHANVGNKTGRGEEKRQKQQSFSVRLGQECGLINGTIFSGGIIRQIILLDCTYF